MTQPSTVSTGRARCWNFSDANMGCGRRVATDWAFEQVDEAIILEDD